jgi:crotonobetainyl-CoA:carnitine CoA-transferase CaiB-like acyl-CoA transferase
MGLFAQERYGLGQYVETTMLCSSGGYVNSNDLVHFDGSGDPPISDSDQRGPSALVRLYQCSDGYLTICVLREADWRKLLSAVDMHTWATDQRYSDARARSANDAALAGDLERVFSGDTALNWERRLTDAGVPAAAVEDATFERFLHDRGLLTPDGHPAFGEYWRFPRRVRVSSPAKSLRGCAVGEHTDAILEELGFTAADREALVLDGVVHVHDQAETRVATRG